MFVCPTAINAITQRGWLNADQFGQLIDGHECAVEPDQSDAFDNLTSVSPLFDIRRPSTIVWTVTLLIVNALNRALRWTRSHVGDEIIERLPTLANRDSAPAIVGVIGGIWVTAALFHTGPTRVFARLAHAVLAKALSKHVDFQTPTRFGVSGTEVRPRNVMKSAAVAEAFPCAVTTNLSFLIGDDKPPKAPTDHIACVPVRHEHDSIKPSYLPVLNLRRNV